MRRPLRFINYHSLHFKFKFKLWSLKIAKNGVYLDKCFPKLNIPLLCRTKSIVICGQVYRINYGAYCIPVLS